MPSTLRTRVSCRHPSGPRVRGALECTLSVRPPGELMSESEQKERGLRLVFVLLGLTLVSGLIDAVSYLGLGHVFTANMTGNVVVLGFAAAGAPGFSVPHTATSLVCFLLGAVAGGRVT